MIAMIGLLITVLVTIGGITPLFTMLNNIDPSLANPFTGFDFGLTLYILGWCAFGLGVIGQPHILTRPMAIKSTNDLKKSRTIYLSWYIVFSAAAILIGLAARVLLPELINQDPELGLPLLALQYLPTFFVGIILAGIFSACISTADSQILVCSATITQTFLSNKKQSIFASRATTLFTLIFIVLFSIFASKSVFFWVILAWSILALVLSPLVFSQCFNIKLSQKSIIAIITTSLLFIYWWIFKLELSSTVNEVLPGFIIITIIIYLFKVMEKK